MSDFLASLKAADSIGMSGHVRPDGDCFGSSMGLYNYIREQFPEKRVCVYLETIAPEFSFISRSEEVKTEPDDTVYDLFICLDCGAGDRLGKFEPLFERAKKNIVIDHHISNTGFGKECYARPEASSTSEIVYTLLDKEKISKNVGEALYLGIVYDTGVFKHSCTSKQTMEIAGNLMELGIPYSKIIDETFYQKTYRQNLILGYCLLKSRLLLDGRVIASSIDKKTMEEYGANAHDLDGVVDQLRITQGVEVAIFLHEMKEKEYKVSLRSNTDLDVNEIVQNFGGGGHKKAAGCKIDGDSEEIINRLTGLIEEAYGRNP
jgi:phosphoesterase RecJ-like protein